ncbi:MULTISPECIES: PPE family protein [Mycobacterium]|uniref:PPE family protein PPE33 n=1 Tax=Mycobacterium kiyosense TaxID=2871094 RepID=A0A9P3UVK5_9MYCO|nr:MULTISPECIES: PPE family protein [Mycobacterium]BDB42591.1 putative PPE family protein PPE33 [Mycobacterium kiyosense]BDE14149.1 putative PPE family protein PPE33 [Mycobacterium sp. 20KCMC460]GLB82982.1 putative PPE family protein PPE33 [Mycobacterium kiyosense]GLB89177.1 putative PPE family protein PPE33 [Mycobacterium kiyosense]GLB93828.1 putative PPE family protein PPE33 [Mycobacterium kiyosense]
MSFAARPPEITSGLMYTGPGAGPMIAAATAWDALAAELQDTAASYGAIIEGLVNDGWTGPSSGAMAAAVAPYVSWMSATATQAKAAGEQAKAAVSAYETAYAAVVPPAEIALNRSELAQLVATNIFGQNTGAIAALEAQYGEMWAQDTTAMFGYANASAAAAKLTPYAEPPQVTDASGLAGQQAAVGQASGLAAGTAAATAAATAAPTAAPAFPFDVVLQALQALGQAGTAYMQGMSELLNTLTGTTVGGPTWELMFGIVADIGRFSTVANDVMSAPNLGMTEFKLFWKPPLENIPKSALGAGLGMAPTGGLTSAVSAGAGEANVVGKLSVPPSWASATPAIRMVSNVLPATSMAAAPAAGIPADLVNQMALGSLTGGAVGSVGAQVYSGSGARARAGGEKGPVEPVKLDSVIAKLQQEPEAVQHWNVDKAGLDGLLDKLSKKPGIHAVHVSSGDKPRVTLPDAQ